MKLDINKILNFIAFATLLILSFNVSTAFGHGYHADEEIKNETQEQVRETHFH